MTRIGSLGCVVLLLAGAPALAQSPGETCTQRIAVLAAAVDAQGAWRDRIGELLAMIRDSNRRGEEMLCRELADELSARITELEV
jgi:hypothetical protein